MTRQKNRDSRKCVSPPDCSHYYISWQHGKCEMPTWHIYLTSGSASAGGQECRYRTKCWWTTCWWRSELWKDEYDMLLMWFNSPAGWKKHERWRTDAWQNRNHWELPCITGRGRYAGFSFYMSGSGSPINAMYYSFSCPYVSTVLQHMLGRFTWQSSEKANLTCILREPIG